MPELPEVETIKNSLSPIIGKKIVSIKTSDKKFRVAAPKNFKDLLINQNVVKISRRSKYILIHLSNDYILVIHLGMSGKVLLDVKLKSTTHNHLEINLNNDATLIFNDPRRFGLYTAINQSELHLHKLFKNLGVEPLTDGFNPNYLYNILKKRAAPIKSLLMDASIVVGVGNIYASESLFRANISPLREAKSLTTAEISALCNSIKIVLLDAIESGGSTLKDYVKSTGDVGYFQHKFQVYGRNGKKCYICKTQILNNRIAGRSTFHCPTCQL